MILLGLAIYFPTRFATSSTSCLRLCCLYSSNLSSIPHPRPILPDRVMFLFSQYGLRNPARRRKRGGKGDENALIEGVLTEHPNIGTHRQCHGKDL
ncbi:hypothetical protein BCR34DRAFT_351289 [Clohesyomyces aquaticus]|uniref:Secreted protein n=1 Tax=Clohesyomyces aquaticus TaxID=1231657 RepID=A0A1Y1ZJ87_9PLEO|nr:hypothetical protein BCR34DRAFT_351289 [Clohesyomyces aquaticus]